MSGLRKGRPGASCDSAPWPPPGHTECSRRGQGLPLCTAEGSLQQACSEACQPHELTRAHPSSTEVDHGRADAPAPPSAQTSGSRRFDQQAVAETPAAQESMQLEEASGLAPTSEPAAAPAAMELSAEEAAAAEAKREKYAAISAAKKQGYAKVDAVQRAKDEEAVADLVKAAISKGEITAITATEFDLLRGAAASC